MMQALKRFKEWARLAPVPPGKMRDGTAHQAFGLNADEKIVLLMIDSRGRVYQVEHATISDANARYICNGKTSLLQLIDEFNIVDGPDWSQLQE